MAEGKSVWSLNRAPRSTPRSAVVVKVDIDMVFCGDGRGGEGRQEGEGTVAWRGRAKEGRGADLVKHEVLEMDERRAEAKA